MNRTEGLSVWTVCLLLLFAWASSQSKICMARLTGESNLEQVRWMDGWIVEGKAQDTTSSVIPFNVGCTTTANIKFDIYTLTFQRGLR